MKITKTYKFKLYNTKRNKSLHTTISDCAGVYNHCIRLHRTYYKLFKKKINSYQLQKHITKLKKLDKYSYWNNIPSQSIQNVVERIDRAYTLFFRNLKRKIKTSPPNFKKRTKYKSFTLKQVGYKLFNDNKIKIGKKIFKYSKSREVPEDIKILTIKRDYIGEVYLYFVVKENVDIPSKTTSGKIVGFDFGLKTFLTASNNNDIKSPLFFKRQRKEIRKLSKKLSKKKKGSKNRRKAKLDLARLHRKIENQRKDFHFKLSQQLINDYDTMIFEDLNLNGMKKRFGKKISDLGFGGFLKVLEYRALVNGKEIKYIDRYFPSSKLCNVCGSKNDNLKLWDRKWKCPICKSELDRDRNASINIYREGASSLGIGMVSPSCKAVLT